MEYFDQYLYFLSEETKYFAMSADFVVLIRVIYILVRQLILLSAWKQYWYDMLLVRKHSDSTEDTAFQSDHAEVVVFGLVGPQSLHLPGLWGGLDYWL